MIKEDLKIVFLGTPEFAVPSLEMLISQGYNVAAVVTQPDRPKGRGHKLAPPPVKERALKNGIPVYQYEHISTEGLETIKELNPNLMITVAFGQILSRELLLIPQYGCINVHASLLPKYRGAAPIEMAIINGEKKTGVTTMYTVYELDAGDIIEKDEMEIPPYITGGELRSELSCLGANTLKRTLEKLVDGTISRTPQDASEATYYPMFPKGYGQIDFSMSAQAIVDFVRGCNPVPCAYTFSGQDKVKIMEVKLADINEKGEPGSILLCDAKKGLFVNTKKGVVEVTKLQFPGGKPMSAKDYLRGKAIKVSKFGKGE